MGTMSGARASTATASTTTTPDRLDADFSKLWLASALSDGGTAIAMGALPLIAIRALDATTFEVALLSVAAGLAGALFALPLGPTIEARRKRPTMILADVTRAVAIGSIPVVAWLGILTFWHLLLVSGVASLGRVVFSGASSAHLKNLVGREHRTEALGKIEATFWLFNAIGPALGGGIVQLLGLTSTMVVQAVSFLGSALGIRAIRKPEPEPTSPKNAVSIAETLAGFTAAWRHPVLRPLLINAVLFSAFIAWIGPLEMVLLLRVLQLPAWQYGLALALPCIGGLVGSWLSARLARRLGERRAMVWSAFLRGVPCVVLPFLPTGIVGLVLYILSTFALLALAGVFRPLYSAVRMEHTNDALMARVSSAFVLASLCAAPLFAFLGGVMASVAGLRPTLFLGILGLIVSGFFLPRKQAWRAADPQGPPLR